MSEVETMSYAHSAPAKPQRSQAVHYSDEIANEILERVSNGDGIMEICSEAGMPRAASWFRWVAADAQLSEAYTRARESCGHVHAAKAVQEAMSATDPAIGRLRMDALKWAASKYAPKNYGDNMQLRHADADGGKLDTQPLVSELLTMLGPGATLQAAVKLEAPAEKRGAFGTPLLNVTPEEPAHGYRPRAKRAGPASDIDDLI